MADNVAITAGVGTTIAADEVSDGTLGSVKVQYVKIMDGTLDGTTKATVGAGGLVVDLGANNDVTITSGTVAATQSGTWNITNISGTISLPTGAATQATLLNVETNTDNTVTSLTSIESVIGGVAHDSADSGNPYKIGAKATTALSGLTLVADADRTNLYAGVDGVLLVRPHTNLESQSQEYKTNTDGASTAMTSGFAAPGAGKRLYLTTLILTNSSASYITVDIRDGSAGSVLATFPVPANSGCVCNLPVPIKFSANTAAAFDGSAAATTLSVTMIGFVSKV